MQPPRLLLVLLLSVLLLPPFIHSAEPTPSFERDVRPLLESRCYKCHSHKSGTMMAGLALDSRSGWATGGDSGPAIVPGKPDESLLIKAVRHEDKKLKMPKGGRSSATRKSPSS